MASLPPSWREPGGEHDENDSKPPSWREPGGEHDENDPKLPIPPETTVVCAGDGSLLRAAGPGVDAVSDVEIDWMAQQRELTLSEAQLTRDYGAHETVGILNALQDVEMPTSVAGALAWPGVATRWKRFCAWYKEQTILGKAPRTAKKALAGFARAVGRVRTYRALALDDAGLQRILHAEDQIFPSGMLVPGVDGQHLHGVVETHGVAKVAVCRLYISHMDQIGGVDPSLSLHDDWQTTSIIASGYASSKKMVHLFELCVPALETLGWTLQEVAQRSERYLGSDCANDHERYFSFVSPASPAGTWFDAGLQRTERYGLYCVPHLKQRLLKLYRFDGVEALAAAVAPYIQRMERLYLLHTLEAKAAEAAAVDVPTGSSGGAAAR